MFRLASFDLSGRRILIIEDEDSVAAKMTEEIEQSGGVAFGPVDCVVTALDWIRREPHVDCAMLDIRHLAETEIPIIGAFGEFRVEVVFVTGFDDWYLSSDS